VAELPSGCAGRLTGSRRLARLRAYLRVNLVAIWSSVAALLVLRLALGPSRTIMNDVYALVACGILLLAAEVLAARERDAAAAAVTIVATWVVALAITWVSPFLSGARPPGARSTSIAPLGGGSHGRRATHRRGSSGPSA
jgi:hypothetical protein